MSGDVVTTIKEYQGLIGLLLGVFLASGWGTRGIIRTVLLTRTRKLNSFRKLQARLKHLHDSDGVCGWLLSGILWVLVLFAVELMLEATVAAQHGQVFVSPLIGPRYIVGAIVMFISANRLQWYRRLENYDTTMAGMDRAIARLEAKQVLHKPPVTAA